MAKKQRKSINDADFFDDAVLDAEGEAVDLFDPDGGGDGDGVVDDAVGDAQGDDDAAVGGEGDDAGSDGSVDDAGAESDKGDGEGSVDPAPQLDDLETAKIAYAEVRKWANERDMQAQKLEERIAQLEAEAAMMQDFDYGDEGEAYDANAFAHIAGNDPQAAFQYALTSGQVTDAQAAIAQVQADSAELAALAASAHREGDANAYGQLRAQSMNAAAQAQQMQGEMIRATQAQAQAPLVAAERDRNIAIAESNLVQATEGDYTARRDDVIRVLRERPYLIASHSAQDIQRGIQDAYVIARAQPQNTTAAAASSIDEIVKKAVSEHVAATRSAKRQAAADAVGGEGGRVGPSSSSQAPSMRDELFEQQRKSSIGARKFMDM